MVVDFHLFREVFLQPQVFINAVLYELDCLLPFNFYRTFSFIPIVEPSLCPPADTGPVRIYRHDTRYVEALDVDVEFSQRINDAAVAYGFVMEFFFMSPLMVERYTL